MKTLAERVHEIELTLREMQSQLSQITTASESATIIPLEEGCAVNLDELEKKMEEQYALMVARAKEIDQLQERILAEVENLRVVVKEKEILLAAREVEFAGLKRILEERVDQLENLAKNRREGRRRGGRLVSFLVDIGKKH